MDCLYKIEVKILSYLQLKELIKLRTVCKRWCTIIDVSIQKNEVNLFVETDPRLLRWKYNHELIDDFSNLTVNRNINNCKHFLDFFKSLKKIFIFSPGKFPDKTSQLFKFFPNLEHIQIIAGLTSTTELRYSTRTICEQYYDVDYKLEKLKTFTYNLYKKQEKANYPKNFKLDVKELTYLSIDTCISKDIDSSIFKNLKYLRIQEMDEEFQAKTTFDELEVLVCLRPFTVLLKNFPKLKQIHYPYFYTDVGKYDRALKQLESKLDIKQIIRKDLIEYYFSGFKCRTNDYLNSIFRAYMAIIKPFRFFDSINHDVLKLVIEKFEDLDLAHEPIEYTYTEEFGERLLQLDDKIIDKLTLERVRLVRLFNKIEKNDNLINATKLFYNNVEKLIVNEAIDQVQLNFLPQVFPNLICFEQIANREKDLEIEYVFLAKFKNLRKFVTAETVISKDDFKSLLFENSSKFFRFVELQDYVFEFYLNGSVLVKTRKDTGRRQLHLYIANAYPTKLFRTKEEFKKTIDKDIDRYIKLINEAGPLGWANM